MSSPAPLLDRPLRPPTATNLLLAGFLSVAIYDLLLDGAFGRAGTIVPPAIWLGDGEESFRLLGAIFLHADPLHFVVNCAVLLLLGTAAERVYGRARVMIAFLLGGVAAGVTSAVLRPGDIAVSASGATAALAGLLAGLVSFRGGTLPEAVENRIKLWVAGILAVFAVLGLVVEPANVAMHLGGFLTGLLLATAFETDTPSVPRPAVSAVAALVLIGAGIALVRVPARARAEQTLIGVTFDAGYLHEIGHSREAVSRLESALALPIESSVDRLFLPDAQNALAWFYVETGKNIERALDLSIESNNRAKNQPAYLDTLGYAYALAGRCREAGDAMGRAAGLDPGYEPRRVEVERACAASERPNTRIEIVPATAAPTPTPPKGPIGA